MKRILAVLSITLCLCACEEIALDGAWDPMELDKTHLNFPQEGGEDALVVLNYSRWWISGAYTDVDQTDGRWEYMNYIHPSSSGGDETCTYDILDGGWYQVTVPDIRSNTAIFKVSPNDTGVRRSAIINMTAGDVFTSISISQE